MYIKHKGRISVSLFVYADALGSAAVEKSFFVQWQGGSGGTSHALRQPQDWLHHTPGSLLPTRREKARGLSENSVVFFRRRRVLPRNHP